MKGAAQRTTSLAVALLLLLALVVVDGCGPGEDRDMAECPNCGAEIDITDYDAGDIVICPECGQPSEVIILWR